MSAITGLPAISVQLGGTGLQPGDAGAMEEVRVHQRLSLPSQCELLFVNPQGRLADAATLPAAESLKVTAPGASESLFAGEVTAVEHIYTASRGHEVRVRGYDVLHRLRKRQPVKSRGQISLADLARELVADLGLSVDGDTGGLVFPNVIQHRQSDLDLLIEMTEQCGFYFTLRGGVLQLTALEGFGEPIPLALGASLLEAHIEVNSDRTCRSVKSSAWDPRKVQPHSASATSARVGREITAGFPHSRFGLDGERTLTADLAPDDRLAEAFAQGELDQRVAAEVSFRGAAEGDPRLRPASPVEISGVSGALAGRYVLTSVDHRVDRKAGFVSEFSSAPPPPQRRTRATSAALGIVTRVNDPEDRGRIRVSLPAHADVETDWMSVVFQGAGAGKGLVILPDVGDRVLVLFLNGDPAQGVVLGGLFGTEKLPDSGVENGAVKRYTLATARGQRVQFDDSGERIRLENSHGSRVELSPEQVLIHSKTKMLIEAVDQAVVIRGKSIDFEKG
jgi:phage baseplate assembly protein gpV/phage protein D